MEKDFEKLENKYKSEIEIISEKFEDQKNINQQNITDLIKKITINEYEKELIDDEIIVLMNKNTNLDYKKINEIKNKNDEKLVFFENINEKINI